MFDLYMETAIFNSECDEAIALYMESVNEYDIRCKEIELAQAQDSLLTESVGYLYEDAAEAANEKGKGAIASFFESIRKFISDLVSKIVNFFKGNKSESEVKGMQSELSNNPEKANEKVEVYDLANMTKSQKRYYEQVKKIMAKHDAGQKLSRGELKKLQAWMNGESQKFSAKKVIIPIGVALAAVASTLVYCKSSGSTLTDIAEAAKDKIGGVVDSTRAKIEDKRDAKNEERLNRENEQTLAKNDAKSSEAAEIMRDVKDQLTDITKQYQTAAKAADKNIETIRAKLKGVEGRQAGIEMKSKYGSTGASRVSGKLDNAVNGKRLDKKHEELSRQLDEAQRHKDELDRDHDEKMRPLIDRSHAASKSATDAHRSSVDSQYNATMHEMEHRQAIKDRDEKRKAAEQARQNRTKAREERKQNRRDEDEFNRSMKSIHKKQAAMNAGNK